VKKFFKSIGIIFITVIIFCIYARFIEPKLLTVHYETIYNDLINEDADEIKILQFSDTHVSKYFVIEDLKNTVSKINEQNPDIVVFTGDLIDQYDTYESKDKIYEIWETLGSIKAPLKYAVYGNHDYGGGAENIYKQIMENSGFELLVNEKSVLEQYNINIIGMDDSIFGDYDSEMFYNLDKNSYNIVLSHEPDVVDYLLENNIDLFLSGHSHGGQINLPIVKLLPLLAEKYTRGLYSFKNARQTQLYVNIGLGTSKIPMRFMAAPQLAVFVLKNNE